MPLKISTYQNQVRPASPRALRHQAAIQDAPLDVANTAGVRFADNLTKQLGMMARAGMKEEADKMEAQISADILDESTQFHDTVRSFEKDYRDSFKGSEARNATQDYDKFLSSEINRRTKRFDGMDPRVQLLWKRQAAQIRQGALNRAGAYSDQQDRIYRKDTTEARASVFLNKVSELGGNDKAVDALTQQFNAEIDALNPGMDMTAYKSKINVQLASTRIDTAIAEKDPERAKRYLKEYKSALGTSYDDMVNHVESARRVMMKEEGAKWAQDQFNAKSDPQKTWGKIAKIKDDDKRHAAQAQYSSLWTVQAKMDEVEVQEGTISSRNRIDSIAPSDLAAAEAEVFALPESNEKERKIKENATNRLNAWKRSGGMEPLTDSGAYIGIRDDILNGALTTREAIKADPRSAKVTLNDLDGDLVGLLDATQKTTDKAINDAFRESFGAKKWDKMTKKNPDLVFSYMKQVKDIVKQTNRGQDTDYIQKVADTLSMKGGDPADNFIVSLFSGDDKLAKGIESGDFTIESLKSGLVSGNPPWLPSEVPDTFDATWSNPDQIDQVGWVRKYGDNGKRAAYLAWTLQNIGPRQ